VRCDHLDPLIEGVIDGSFEPSADERAHLESCERCRARLAQARSIEQWLAARELPQPPATFTATVMARVGDAQWQTERVIDMGFNLAVAAGVLLIVIGGAGLAWFMGLFGVTADLATIVGAIDSQLTGRVMSQVQTIAVSAVLLTLALVLWWWAEAATD
jgi:predicted anti-sigma-YlaC factor YlaD